MGAWHSSTDPVDDNAAHPYTNSYICQDEYGACAGPGNRNFSAVVSTGLERVLEGLVEPAELKPIAGRVRPGRHGVAAVEQQVRLLAEHQSKDGCRGRHNRRPMQHSADFSRHLCLRADVRSHRVHRSAVVETLEGQTIQSHEVVDMNPGEPLPAIAKRAAGEHPKGKREQSKGQGAATKNEPGAHEHEARAERLDLACRSLPLLADSSQEGVAGPALLGDQLLATVAVVIDPRCVDEDGGTP